VGILSLNRAGFGIEVTDVETRAVRAYDGACDGMGMGCSDVVVPLLTGVVTGVEEEVEICKIKIISFFFLIS
jgi:hypothetical protein